jgi:hypothetical protein
MVLKMRFVVFWVVMPFTSTLKIEVMYSTKTLITVYRTTWYCNPVYHKCSIDCCVEA